MADGLLGEDTLHALRVAELDVKQKPVVVLILLHLKEERNATDYQPNQETVIPKHAPVSTLNLEFHSTKKEVNNHSKFNLKITIDFN